MNKITKAVLPILLLGLAAGCDRTTPEETATLPPAKKRGFLELKYSLRPLLVSADRVQDDRVTRPFVGDLVITYVVDRIDKLEPVTPAHLKRWRIDGERLHKEAMASYLAYYHARPEQITFSGTTQGKRTTMARPVTTHFLKSSLILLDELFRANITRIFGTWEGLLVAVPNQEVCLVIRADDTERRERLRKELEGLHTKTDRPLYGCYLATSEKEGFRPGPAF